jgi:hypothetical protein
LSSLNPKKVFLSNMSQQAETEYSLEALGDRFEAWFRDNM